MRKENRIVAIPIDWRIIEDLVLDKIVGLPKDAKIIGIKHEPCQMNDTIGIYSKKFRKVPDGVIPPNRYLNVETKYDEKKNKSVVSRLSLMKRR